MRTVGKLLSMRAHRRLRYGDLVKLRVSVRKVAPFVETADHRPRAEPESAALRAFVRATPQQADMFGH